MLCCMLPKQGGPSESSADGSSLAREVMHKEAGRGTAKAQHADKVFNKLSFFKSLFS